MYIDRKEAITNLTLKHKSITINNAAIDIRPMLIPAQRITDPEFSHILSFKRQVYVNPDDIKEIPSFFTITSDDTVYRIFTTADKLDYKHEGHIARQCPYHTVTNQTMAQTNTNSNSHKSDCETASTTNKESTPKTEMDKEKPNANKLTGPSLF